MSYPMIFNGDHAEFEIEHANTPLHERPDWPLPSFDAQDWATAFKKKYPAIDEGIMLAWFACALMRGFDEHASRTTPALAVSEEKVARELAYMHWPHATEVERRVWTNEEWETHLPEARAVLALFNPTPVPSKEEK